ncbi:MAG: metalloregulator ArsR/SmtB family transcription factor [Candidatus Eisenbacteria bacterium]|nr:metalloregulator ArsR/SmtB family transcription factor [Candidatus Eisenbacteria bacterium]
MEAISPIEQVVTGFKALADPVRLRLLGLLAERERSGQELAGLLGVSAPTVSHHLKLLKGCGFVLETRHAPYTYFALDPKALQSLVESVSRREKVQQWGAEEEIESDIRRVLNAFFEGPRLKSIPAQRRKKEIVFEELLRRLPRKSEYTEQELSLWLKAIHEDFCTIRREFLIGGYMIREAGIFRLTEKGREIARSRRGATPRAGREGSE